MEGKQILANARASSNINPTQLAEYLLGGQDRRQKFESIMDNYEKSETLPTYDKYDFNRSDQIGLTIKNSIKRKPYWIDWVNEEVVDEFMTLDNGQSMGSIGLLMTLKQIQILGTKEQASKWVPKINSYEIVCCYAQTELGTGSDVQNLGTTAVFDPETQEFVLNTPDIKSIKWWPGDLGVFSTHALVVAQMYSNGQHCGIQNFFIQIRDMNTLKQLPGIEAGDIGPKLGYETKDNGFLKLTNYRAPKNSMLSKYALLSPEGEFKNTANPKILYSGMLRSRLLLLCDSYVGLMKSAVITTRYSLIRTQFKTSAGIPIPIFDYQLQKEKIFALLSDGYALNAANHIVRNLVYENYNLVKKNDFSLLKTVHITLSGHKAWFTEICNFQVGQAIRACGGHGYSLYSGLPMGMKELFPEQILEGENTVLMLQVSRELLKLFQYAMKGALEKIPPKFDYLLKGDELKELEVPVDIEWLTSLPNLLKLYQKASYLQLERTAMKMYGFVSKGEDPKDVWDKRMGSNLVKAGRIHALYSVLDNVYKRYLQIEQPEIKIQLERLFILFALRKIEELAVFFVSPGSITDDHLDLIQEFKEKVYEELTPHALTLAEGTKHRDWTLFSAIGHSNGKPYENLYEWANKYSLLNQLEDRVHPEMLKSWLPYSKKLRENEPKL